MAVAYRAQCNSNINVGGYWNRCGWNDSGLPNRPTRCPRCDGNNITVEEIMDFGENKREINWGVDYYEVLGLPENATKAQILGKRGLMTQYKNELDNKITPKVADEIKEEFRRRGIPVEVSDGSTTGMKPSNQYIWEYEARIQGLHGKDKVDPRIKEATDKYRAAIDAIEVLKDRENRQRYDQGVGGVRGMVKCYSHQSQSWGGKAEKIIDKNHYATKKRNHCWFCSDFCINEYFKKSSETPKTPATGPNDDNVPCFKCGKNQATDWKHRRSKNQWWCGNCWNKVPNCAWCRRKKGWYREKGGTGSERFCSQTCLDNWNADKENRKPKPKTAIQYLTELTGLIGWDLLTEDEKDKFKDMIRKPGSSEPDWKKAIEEAKVLIKKRREENGDEGDEGDGDGDNKNLPTEIQKAIREIEAELNKEPKITAKEQEGFEWKAYIKNSENLTELNSRKEEILNQIREARKQKLNHFLENVIQQIKNELARDPKIENSELSNPNWETKLKSFTEKSQIESLRDTILAEITRKREAKEIGSQLDQLISQAQTAANNKEWEKLKELLKRINYYQDSRIYEDKKSTIKELENKLATGDFAKFQEGQISSLEDFLNKGEKIDPNELSAKNRDFQNRIKQATTPEEVTKIVEEVQDDAGANKAEKVVNKLFEEAKTIETDQQKSEFRQKVDLLKNGNKWERKVYEKYKDEFEKILAAWVNSNDSNKPSQPDPGSGKDKGLPKTLIVILVIAAVVVVVLIILLIIRNRRKRNEY